MNFETAQKEEKKEVCVRCGGTPVITDGLCGFCFDEEHPEFYREESDEAERHSSVGSGGERSESIQNHEMSRRKVQKIFSKKKKRKGGDEFSST